MSDSKPGFLRFEGHNAFTSRLVLSTLTGRPIHISKIRNSSTKPGLAPHEVSFLRLLEAVTNGSAMQISYTGTTITYQPGLITGTVPGAGASEGDVIEHTLPETCKRGVTYFLLPLALLAPFAKAHMNVRFSGPGVITAATETGDLSVDAFRTAVLPVYGLFGIPPVRIELRVLQRSCAGPGGRGGGGLVELRFASQVRLPRTLHLLHRGSVRRIRGVAYATGVSASNNGRMIQAAREALAAVPHLDMHIAAQYDPAPITPGPDKSGAKKKTGIGFGLCMVAELTTPGTFCSADVVSPPGGGVVPEEIGKRCALQLLQSISEGGCASRAAAPTMLTLMAMGSEDIGRLRIAHDVLASEEIVTLARDVKTFGASGWGIRGADGDGGDGGDGDFIVSVKGTGLGNVGRKVA